MIMLEQQYSYEMIFDEMKELASNHSGFLKCRVIGQSHDDRLIPMICMGRGDKVLYCTAGIHGREIVNPVVLLKMMEVYTKAYEDGILLDDQYDVRQLLQNYSIYFIPLVNPDGYEIATRGFWAIQNPKLRQELRIRQISHESWKYNARGVDINRNFPCKSYIQQQYFEYPGSENETRALMQVFRENKGIGYMDFHSRGRIIYYFRQAMPYQYNQNNYKLARYLQKLSHYNLGRREEEFFSNLSGGNSVHFYSETTNRPAITVETVDDSAHFPLTPDDQKKAFEEVYRLPLGVLLCLK